MSWSDKFPVYLNDVFGISLQYEDPEADFESSFSETFPERSCLDDSHASSLEFSRLASYEEFDSQIFGLPDPAPPSSPDSEDVVYPNSPGFNFADLGLPESSESITMSEFDMVFEENVGTQPGGNDFFSLSPCSVKGESACHECRKANCRQPLSFSAAYAPITIPRYQSRRRPKTVDLPNMVKWCEVTSLEDDLPSSKSEFAQLDQQL